MSSGISGRTTVVFPAQWAVPGTEFLDAETGGQKSAQETANACRDRKAGTIPANIPAETSYLEFAWKPVVRSDWMVADAVQSNPSPLPNSLLTGKLTGNFADSGALRRFWRPVDERIQ